MLKSLKSDKNALGSKQWDWVMDYALSMCQAEIDWLKEIEGRLGAVQQVSRG
jgi:hypothetical protein